MSRFKDTFYDNNYDDPDTAYTFGPYTVGVSVNKLTYVKCNLVWGQPGQAYEPTAEAANPIMWGVQVVAHGASPSVLPADAGAGSFLWVQDLVSNEWGHMAWYPSTDNAAVLPFGGSVEQWRGQQFWGEEIDFYVNYGLFSGGTFPDIYAAHTLQFACTY